MPDKSLLFSQLYRLGAIQFGEFTLKSGIRSPIYINFRKIISHPSLIQLAGDLLHEKAKEITYKYICGVPYTALPIACAISLTYQKPMVLRRKEKKAYGTKEIIEGDYHVPNSCIIIEDVVTSGSSIIETAQDLRSVGFEVKHAFALLFRGQTTKLLTEQDIQLHSLIDLSALLNFLLDQKLIHSPKEITIIENILEGKN